LRSLQSARYPIKPSLTHSSTSFYHEPR
jgi:hypothetical protein